MSWPYIILGILGLALLMVVHEGGHLLLARAFGMRVIKFSVGFGPAIWRHQPSGSDTVYQVALIPFLAYVQIAGMNPLEEVDPDDKGSYANASLIGRVAAIFGGPLANYLFASVLFFGALMIGGKQVATTKVEVLPEGAAKTANMKSGDKIVAIDGTKIADFEQMRKIILANPNTVLEMGIERDGEKLKLEVKPAPKGKDGGGLIGVTAQQEFQPVGLEEAAYDSVVLPARVVQAVVVGLTRIIFGKEEAQLSGPIGIVKETGKAMHAGSAAGLRFLGILSAYLAGFNLLPFPALDGGRLMFLGYEAVTRRRPNARVEAHVHAIGLLMLLALILVVSVLDVQKFNLK